MLSKDYTIPHFKETWIYSGSENCFVISFRPIGLQEGGKISISKLEPHKTNKASQININ